MQLSQEGDGGPAGAAYSAARMGINRHLTGEEGNGILHAVMSAPPANVLEPGLLEALDELVDALERGPANVLVLSSAVPDFFAVGPEFGPGGVDQVAAYKEALRGPLERLAGCARPSIAAIDGRALGAGLELAMVLQAALLLPDRATRIPRFALLGGSRSEAARSGSRGWSATVAR